MPDTTSDDSDSHSDSQSFEEIVTNRTSTEVVELDDDTDTDSEIQLIREEDVMTSNTSFNRRPPLHGGGAGEAARGSPPGLSLPPLKALTTSPSQAVPALPLDAMAKRVEKAPPAWGSPAHSPRTPVGRGFSAGRPPTSPNLGALQPAAMPPPMDGTLPPRSAPSTPTVSAASRATLDAGSPSEQIPPRPLIAASFHTHASVDDLMGTIPLGGNPPPAVPASIGSYAVVSPSLGGGGHHATPTATAGGTPLSLSMSASHAPGHPPVPGGSDTGDVKRVASASSGSQFSKGDAVATGASSMRPTGRSPPKARKGKTLRGSSAPTAKGKRVKKAASASASVAGRHAAARMIDDDDGSSVEADGPAMQRVEARLAALETRLAARRSRSAAGMREYGGVVDVADLSGGVSEFTVSDRGAGGRDTELLQARAKRASAAARRSASASPLMWDIHKIDEHMALLTELRALRATETPATRRGGGGSKHPRATFTAAARTTTPPPPSARVGGRPGSGKRQATTTTAAREHILAKVAESRFGLPPRTQQGAGTPARTARGRGGGASAATGELPDSLQLALAHLSRRGGRAEVKPPPARGGGKPRAAAAATAAHDDPSSLSRTDVAALRNIAGWVSAALAAAGAGGDPEPEPEPEAPHHEYAPPPPPAAAPRPALKQTATTPRSERAAAATRTPRAQPSAQRRAASTTRSRSSLTSYAAIHSSQGAGAAAPPPQGTRTPRAAKERSASARARASERPPPPPPQQQQQQASPLAPPPHVPPPPPHAYLTAYTQPPFPPAPHGHPHAYALLPQPLSPAGAAAAAAYPAFTGVHPHAWGVPTAAPGVVAAPPMTPPAPAAVPYAAYPAAVAAAAPLAPPPPLAGVNEVATGAGVGEAGRDADVNGDGSHALRGGGEGGGDGDGLADGGDFDTDIDIDSANAGDDGDAYSSPGEDWGGSSAPGDNRAVLPRLRGGRAGARASRESLAGESDRGTTATSHGRMSAAAAAASVNPPLGTRWPTPHREASKGMHDVTQYLYEDSKAQAARRREREVADIAKWKRRASGAHVRRQQAAASTADVSAEEERGMLRKAKVVNTRNKLYEVFQTVDRRGTGVVSMGTLHEWLQQSEEALGRQYLHPDQATAAATRGGGGKIRTQGRNSGGVGAADAPANEAMVDFVRVCVLPAVRAQDVRSFTVERLIGIFEHEYAQGSCHRFLSSRKAVDTPTYPHAPVLNPETRRIVERLKEREGAGAAGPVHDKLNREGRVHRQRREETVYAERIKRYALDMDACTFRPDINRTLPQGVAGGAGDDDSPSVPSPPTPEVLLARPAVVGPKEAQTGRRGPEKPTSNGHGSARAAPDDNLLLRISQLAKEIRQH